MSQADMIIVVCTLSILLLVLLNGYINLCIKRNLDEGNRLMEESIRLLIKTDHTFIEILKHQVAREEEDDG